MGSFRRLLLMAPLMHAPSPRLPSPLGRPCPGSLRAAGLGMSQLESRAFQWLPSLGMVVGGVVSVWLLLQRGR